MKYALKNAVILDGTKDMEPLRGQSVLVEGETIVGLAPAGSEPMGFEPVDLTGKYLMPGLFNMHVHLAGSGKPQKKQRDNEKLVKTIMGSGLTRAVAYSMVRGFARDELMSGVTTIRTMGGLGNFDSRLRDEIAAGRQDGPRILAANQGISVPCGHMAGSVAIVARSIDEALAHLEQSEREGVDLVKLMITGGVLDAKEKGVPGELKMAPEMVKAVCDRAHAAGYVVGLQSTATVHYHLNALRDAGLIEMDEMKKRAISLPDAQRADRIPVVGVVTAGVPILATENIEGYIPWDGESGCFVLRVRGDSMIGAGILDGDKVVVRPQPDAENGQIVVALLDDSATVKRLKKTGRDVWLMPENPSYEPIPGNEAKILGRVKALIREY